MRQALTQGRPLEMRSVSEIHATLRRVAGWLPPSHTPAIRKSGADGRYSCRLYPSDVSAQCPGGLDQDQKFAVPPATGRAVQTQQSAYVPWPPNAEEWEQSRAEGRVNWWRLATIASPVLPSWLPVNRYRLLPSWRGRVIPYRLQH